MPLLQALQPGYLLEFMWLVFTYWTLQQSTKIIKKFAKTGHEALTFAEELLQEPA